jgi:hypothetical protein
MLNRTVLSQVAATELIVDYPINCSVFGFKLNFCNPKGCAIAPHWLTRWL